MTARSSRLTALLVSSISLGSLQPATAQFFPFGQRQTPVPAPPARAPERPRPRPESPASVSSPTSGRTGTTTILRPTVIAQPGNYVLGGTVSSASTTTAAIVIAASGVTLDLNGFSIKNLVPTNPNAAGVAVQADNVRVLNGAIENFSGEYQSGVVVEGAVSNFVIEDLRISDCDTGIVLNPDNNPGREPTGGRISRCSIHGGSIGILAFPSRGVTVDGCTVTGAKAARDQVGEGSGAVLRGADYLIRDCSFTGNETGLRLEASRSILRDSLMSWNGGAGLYVSAPGSQVMDCVFGANRREGAVLHGGSLRFSQCTFDANAGAGVALGGVEATSEEADAAPAAAKANSPVVLERCSITGNAAEGVLSRSGGNPVVVDGATISENARGSMSLQPADVWRGCFLSATPKGGRDGGGSVILTQPTP